MRFDSLQEWLNWLESSHPTEIELGLERSAKVAQALDLNFKGCKVITVAGTNGKGSCVAVLNSLLTWAGYKVGAFTSPHFLDYNERIMINGVPVSDREIIESFERIDECRQTTSLTYFEFGTLAALDIFNRSHLDVIILEVGLGGRLDVVNIVDADVAVITSIDIDHVAWLGPDRESIGAEKAGVFRATAPAICADPNPPESIAKIANSLGCRLLQRGEQFKLSPSQSSSSVCDWVGEDIAGREVCLSHLTLPTLPLGSIAAAIQAIELLSLQDSSSGCRVDYQRLQDIRLPGRFQQVLFNERQVVLDVAHNPAAAAHLVHQLSSCPTTGRTLALVAMMADKDVEGIIKPLADVFSGWFLGDLRDNPRAIKALDLENTIRLYTDKPIERCADIREAFYRVHSLMEETDRLVVFGSFFTVAEVMALIGKDNGTTLFGFPAGDIVDE